MKGIARAKAPKYERTWPTKNNKGLMQELGAEIGRGGTRAVSAVCRRGN